MPTIARAIPQHIQAVLASGRIEDNRYYLPGQLDRATYTATNKVLTTLGGAWVRKVGAHVFDGENAERLEHAIATGSYEKPDDMGWFPTPSTVVEKLLNLAGDLSGRLVLEPSGGEGRIAMAARARGAQVRAVELHPGRAATLAGLLGAENVIEGDFLAVEPFPVDVVIANPPFARRADVKHLMHALRFVKPGGRLVSVMSASIGFRQDNLTTELRERLDSITALPEGSFRESGTDVNTVLVVATGR